MKTRHSNQAVPHPDPACHVRAAVWQDDETAIARVRRAVFIEEQSVPEALEWETLDARCLWYVVVCAGEIVGIVRLLPQGRIGRMAVLRHWRGRGLGTALLTAALAKARHAGLTAVSLSAQMHALSFYARAGFQAVGPEYLDAGIPHRTMTLEFT